MTSMQSKGFTFEVSEPLVASSSQLFTLQNEVSTYGHLISVDGGFINANMIVNVQLEDAEEWFENGLGRYIRVYNPDLGIMFEGFVNLVTVTGGPFSNEARGPLMDIINRLKVVFAPMDESIDPPAVGTTAETIIYEDTDSQAKFGIFERVIDGSVITADDAAQAGQGLLPGTIFPPNSSEFGFPIPVHPLLDPFNPNREQSLQVPEGEFGFPVPVHPLLNPFHPDRQAVLEGTYVAPPPDTSAAISPEARQAQLAGGSQAGFGGGIGGGGQNVLSMKLDLLGPIHYAAIYEYENASTALGNASDKIEAILTAELNSFISSDYTSVDDNAYQTSLLTDGNVKGWEEIKAVVNLGDAAFDRWLFGVYEDRVAHYSEAPSEIALRTRIFDNLQQIETVGGEIVQPWDLRPGQWIEVTDWLIGRFEDVALNENPRNKFIESVRFTFPYSVNIAVGKTNRVTQIMAQYGLGGL